MSTVQAASPPDEQLVEILSADYDNRRVEITGPTDRKLVINALNSGAKGFMADFEDASSPTWRNQVAGHANLIDAIEGTIAHDGADGRHYKLVDDPATLLVRPRGWHLPEKHLQIDGEPVAGAFMDFGLYAFTAAGGSPSASAGCTCTCPSWSTTSRRRSGTTSSPSREKRSPCPKG